MVVRDGVSGSADGCWGGLLRISPTTSEIDAGTGGDRDCTHQQRETGRTQTRMEGEKKGQN